jgi:hypothetical protein
MSTVTDGGQIKKNAQTTPSADGVSLFCFRVHYSREDRNVKYPDFIHIPVFLKLGCNSKKLENVNFIQNCH